MAADLLSALGFLNIAAAVAILLVLFLRRTVRRAFGARVAYALWLLVPLASLATLFPARRIMEPVSALPTPVSEFAITTTAGETVSGWAVQAGPPFQLADLALPAVGVWLAGTLAGLALLLLRQKRSVDRLGALAPDRKPGVWRAANPAVGPAVIGFVSPRIVLPSDFDTRFDADERIVVLAHEAHHLAAHDARLNALVSVLQCLCWFNPLAHLAAREFRADQELACDETILAAYPDRRRTYADALLKTQFAAAPLPLGCYWPARSASPLRERISMLKHDLPSRTRRFAGAGLIAALAAGGAASAWAAKPVERIAVSLPAPTATPAAPAVLATAAPTQTAPRAAQPAAVAPAPQTEAAAPAPQAGVAAPAPAPSRWGARQAWGEWPAWPEWPEWPKWPEGPYFEMTDAQRQAIAAATRDLEVQVGSIQRQAQAAARNAEVSAERARAMAELAELMKPSAAEMERLRQITELSKPSEAERERLRKLRELQQQRSPEEIERQRKLREKMKELNLSGLGPSFAMIPPPPPVPGAVPAPSAPAFGRGAARAVPAPPTAPSRPAVRGMAIPAPPPPPAAPVAPPPPAPPPPVCNTPVALGNGNWACND